MSDKDKKGKLSKMYDEKKKSHLRSVQDGSILDYLYKGIDLFKTLILSARDSLSRSIEKKNQIKDMEENLDLDGLRQMEEEERSNRQ